MGSQIRTTTIRRGIPFVCPRCGTDCEGSIVEYQRYVSLLGVRITPLAVLEQLVQCDTCEHRCDLGVLDIPTTAQVTAYLTDALRHGVALMVRATEDDGPDAVVRDTALQTVRAAGHEYAIGDLERDLVAVDTAGPDGTCERFGRLVHELTAHGKQGFLHRLAAIALADGDLSHRERQTLLEVGVGLGMAPPHLNGVLATTELHLERA